LIVSLELIAPGTLKFSLNNASANTSLTALPKMQAQRFWIERTVQDAKSHIGVAQ
jgi:SRSO17 transposase